MRCEMFGDMDAGQCYGQGICCGRGKCIFSEHSVCRQEESSRVPCRAGGEKCMLPGSRQGNCVPGSNLCCAAGMLLKM